MRGHWRTVPAGMTAALYLLPALAAAPQSAAAASALAERPAHCTPSAPGRDSFCTVSNVRLHYVDWGGAGPAVVLLAGLGSSARIFDDFAPLLAHGHRVLALTRRGYGASSDPPDHDYSNKALVGDILGLLDALGIRRASFVGHSIAGGELAALGSDHPERVDRLVYLDAAYDRRQVPQLMAGLPVLPEPDTASRRDLDSLARWREASLGVHLAAVRHDLEQVSVAGADGWHPRTTAAVEKAVLAGDMAAKVHWELIPAPSLALFSSKDVADQVPPNATVEQREAFVQYSLHKLRPWMLRAQADFIEHAQCGVAIELPHSTHHLFLEHPRRTARLVLDFLSSPSPCQWQPSPAVDCPRTASGNLRRRAIADRNASLCFHQR